MSDDFKPQPQFHPDGVRGDNVRGDDGRGDNGRGRQADSPVELPPRSWLDILLRAKDTLKEKQLGLVAAGVAFYFFLALVPSLAALVSIYGLVSDPAQVEQHVADLSALPVDVREVIGQQLMRQAERPTRALGWTLAGSLLLSFWSASRGTRALMQALNLAYREREKRGYFWRTLIAIQFAVGAIVLALVALFAIAVVPAIVAFVDLGVLTFWTTAIASTAVLVACFVVALAALYRWGPSREKARWRWISPGAVFAVGLWLLISAPFSMYVAKFGSFDETYGPLGGVVVLLLWLWLSAGVVLLGAVLNGEMEHQTARDTTTGPPRPRGERGAYVADTIGHAR